MSLTRAAIRLNRVTLVVYTLAMLAGVLAYVNLPKEEDPGFVVRTVVISTFFAGASPERVELLVTDLIEKKIQEMPEVDNITSESRTGISLIYVNFKETYKVMRPIFDDLRRKVDAVANDLPDGIRGPFVDDEFGDVFGSIYTLRGDGFSYAELKRVADEIRDRLLKEPLIAKVNIHGVQDEAIFVEYNNARLTELDLSPKQLSGVLASANILSTGGNILSGRERVTLEPTGNLESLDDLRRTVLQLPSGSVVYLGDIAQITRSYIDPPDSIARVNGEPTLSLSVSLTDGGDILKLGERLDQLIPEIQAQYPWGIEIDKVWFQARLVRTNVDNFVSNLLQAVGIVVLVMVIALGLRTGLVVASLIPSAIIITFFAMQLVGITINQISLAALIISLGLLVDNAIVMVESILVKREQGVGAVEAAVQSGKELFMPLLVSSLTTGAAFMPIALAESSVGEYTSDIFYVVTLSLLISWILAMTVVPMLTTQALKVAVKVKQEMFEGRWYDFYRVSLTNALKHRLVFAMLVLGLFSAAVFGMRFVPQIFIEQSEDPVFTGKFELPIGTSIETSQAVLADIDEFIRRSYFQPEQGDPMMSSWLTFIGEGGPRFRLSLSPPSKNPANSFLIGNTTSGKLVDEIMAGIEAYVSEQHPDVEVQLSRLENGPPVGYPIVVRISGPQFDPLYELADRVTNKLYELDGVTSVKNTWGLQTKKLIVDIDQERARRAGVTNDDVAYSLKASLTGIKMSEFREDDLRIPITLRSIAADRQDIGKLDGLTVYSQATGNNVPLKQVADVRLAFEPGVVERRDRSRTLSLKVQLRDGITANEVNRLLSQWLIEDQANWPRDYVYELGGEAEESGDANASIAAKLPIAMMVIILLLVSQFNSVRKPLIILLTIPLGLIGITFGLLLVHSSFGFFTLLGIIALSGIIINNAIVLLDRIKIEIEELGRDAHAAVLHACLQRFRPIMLTTATTVLGMMPLWWGGTAMFKPMAITIIFGLAFAAALTLLVVPVLYSAMYGLSFKDYQFQK